MTSVNHSYLPWISVSFREAPNRIIKEESKINEKINNVGLISEKSEDKPQLHYKRKIIILDEMENKND